MRKLLFALFLAAFAAVAAEPDTAGLDSLRQSAERGDADAQYELGILYEFGYHLPDHNSAAYVWYSRAAEQGHAGAARRRDVLKNQLSGAEWERAQTELKAAAPPPSATPTTAAR